MNGSSCTNGCLATSILHESIHGLFIFFCRTSYYNLSYKKTNTIDIQTFILLFHELLKIFKLQIYMLLNFRSLIVQTNP